MNLSILHAIQSLINKKFYQMLKDTFMRMGDIIYKLIIIIMRNCVFHHYNSTFNA